MVIEDKFPERFKKNAYHPTPFVYAWKRKELEKLFEELMQSNIAIKSGETWVVYKDKIDRTIPLKSGRIEIVEWQNESEDGEEWYDFVERSIKETLDFISNWDLEKEARPDLIHKIWYHFDFLESE